jgi:putative endonuclease
MSTRTEPRGQGTEPRREGSDPRRALGAWGERLAARYLREHGLAIVDRNWRCRYGEIDIVARDGDCLVFCEVKTRRSERFGGPVEAVHPHKAVRLRRLAVAWLRAHDARAPRIRIDVIGILRPRSGPVLVRHVEGVGG